MHFSPRYVHDYPVEQLYRDNRLNMIHEGAPPPRPQTGAPLLPSERLALEWSLAAPGTAGVHANTLLGRKLRDGRAAPLFAQMRASAAAADEEAAALPPDSRAESALLRELAGSLREAVARAESVTEVLLRSRPPREASRR